MVTLAICQNPLCPRPNREFEPTRKNNAYCSPACRQAALRNRKKESQETLLDQRLRKLPVSVASTIKSISEEHNLEAAIQALSAINLLLLIADAWPKEVCDLVKQDQQKMADLDADLARYRQICDLSDRKRLEDRFMGLGAAFDYRRLINYNVQSGEEAWRAFLQGADDATLAAALVNTEAFYSNWMAFTDATDLKKTEKRIAELEQTIQRYMIADQKAKEAITEMQFGTSRSGNRIDALEQELARANKTIERYESLQRAMNDAEDQRLRELRQAFLELGERQAYQSMNVAHLRTICPSIIENTVGEGKDRWQWACESFDQGALMVVLTSVFSHGQENAEHVRELERQIEEEQGKFVQLRDDFMRAAKKIGTLERHVQRFERLGTLRNRESMLQELVLLGGRLNYASLTDLGIEEGIENWLTYVRGLCDADLAKAIAHGYWQADSLAMAVIEASETKEEVKMRQRIEELEREVNTRSDDLHHLKESHGVAISTMNILLAQAQAAQHALEAKLAEQQQGRVPHLTMLQAYLHTHQGGSLSLCRGRKTLQITAIRNDGVGCVTGQGLIDLCQEEIEQLWQWVTIHADVSAGAGDAEDNQVLREQTQEGEQASQQQEMLSRLMPLQAYLHTHFGHSIPLRRGKITLAIKLVRNDSTGHASLEGGVSLSDAEIEQMLQWVADKTNTSTLHTSGHAENRVLRQRVEELEAERAGWIAWKEAEVRGAGDLTVMREYLQAQSAASIPIQRNGVTVRILALGEDAVAVSEDHGMIRLSDEELQQGRVWVCKKNGMPIIATWLPIGSSSRQEQDRLQFERELDAVRSENQELRRDLTRYVPPPRSLLECTLRQWCKLTNVFLHEKPLVGKDLDAYIGEFSNRRLLSSIQSAESCYFLDKHRRRRIGIIAEAIEQGRELLYRGDRDLVLRSIDVQGLVTLATGMQCWLNTDDVEQFWALLVAEAGQQHVGGNGAVSSLQQYLCEHLGQSLPLGCGKDDQHLILIDDDRLAVTTRRKPKKLYEDDLEQAWRWVKQQS